MAWVRKAVALGVLVLAPGGCARLTNDTRWTVFEPTRATLQVGSEQRFRLDWTATPGRDGAPRVAGYVYNTANYPVERARVLIDAFDGAGTLVGQRLVWLPGVLPTGDRTYFEVPAPGADHYQVTLWDYNVAPRGP